MKKTSAILLALLLMVAMTGCVSQSDYDELLAQRDALQEEYNALREERDTLQTIVDRHCEIISAIDSENYETAIGILSEKQIAKEMAEKGDIEDYLVTVELTEENFHDYFEFVARYGVNAFGEDEEWSLNFVTVSKAYDAGLIIYRADFKIEVAVTDSSAYNGRTDVFTNAQTFDCTESYMPGFGFGGFPGETKYVLEACSATATRVVGTVTFVKAEYVTGYELGEISLNYSPSQQAEITLVNGERFSRTVYYGYKY